MITQTKVEIHKGRCAYCGKETEVEYRSFQDSDGSEVDDPVCFPCQVSMGMRVARCSICGEKLLYHGDKEIWVCIEHGKQNATWEDSRLFKYVRVDI